MTVELALFLALSLIAIVAALGMLLSSNAIYSALLLVVNFVVVAVFYLLLGAPFIAMVQVTVYAGAIMVLFLFVIMMLAAEKLALMLGLGLISLVGYVILSNGVGATPQALDNAAAYGSPAAVGKSFLQDYLFPFEVTSLLLLVALVGAVVLTGVAEHRRRSTRPSRRS